MEPEAPVSKRTRTRRTKQKPDHQKIVENRTDDIRDGRGRFARGGPGGPGRRRGSKNRIPVDARKAIHEALNAPPGAVSFLTKLRNSRVASDRAAFLHLVARTIPREVTIEGGLDLGDGQPQVVVVLPDNGRGPLPGETAEQFRERYERQQE
jgi:hypothetical protein